MHRGLQQDPLAAVRHLPLSNMRIALGSDLQSELTNDLERQLRERGHEPVLFGALSEGHDKAWPVVGRAVAEAVTRGVCDQGIVCCWTGTGVTIAANKVAGARAALCNDAETARGARTWNDANILALSIRSTSIAVAAEILTAWFDAGPTDDASDRAMIAQIE